MEHAASGEGQTSEQQTVGNSGGEMPPYVYRQCFTVVCPIESNQYEKHGYARFFRERKHIDVKITANTGPSDSSIAGVSDHIESSVYMKFDKEAVFPLPLMASTPYKLVALEGTFAVTFYKVYSNRLSVDGPSIILECRTEHDNFTTYCEGLVVNKGNMFSIRNMKKDNNKAYLWLIRLEAVPESLPPIVKASELESTNTETTSGTECLNDEEVLTEATTSETKSNQAPEPLLGDPVAVGSEPVITDIQHINRFIPQVQIDELNFVQIDSAERYYLATAGVPEQLLKKYTSAVGRILMIRPHTEIPIYRARQNLKFVPMEGSFLISISADRSWTRYESYRVGPYAVDLMLREEYKMFNDTDRTVYCYCLIYRN